jgi:BirA family biotin operon repressor/biotin-[acetyl-CoA-carboxylase] ligase
MLSFDEVEPLLETTWLGRAWRAVDVCGSTNDEAAAWARAGGPTGAVVVADVQSRGRGRLGRAWHAAPGEALLFSTVLRPPLAPPAMPPLTLAAGVALAEAVARLDIAPALKWPNDLLVDGRKAAGILTEMTCSGARVEHVVVGIGVNLNVAAFPDELAAIATSLHHARSGEIDRAGFAALLCERLEAWHDRFVADGPGEVARAW